MKSLLAALVVSVAFAVTLAPPAQAHNTDWYWNAYKAQQYLRREGLEWRRDFDPVGYARCYGKGDWIRSNDRERERLYRHFWCYVEPRDDDPYYITFHVTGKYVWTATFGRWA